MSPKSMTGFARSSGERDGFVWEWELRSLNGRGLDVRLRLPSGTDSLEPRARKILQDHLSRGNCMANLMVRDTGARVQFQLNEDALERLAAIADEIGDKINGAKPRIDGLLALKGVVELVEPELPEGVEDARRADVLAGLESAAHSLVEARTAEGLRLSAVLRQQVDEIERLMQEAARDPSRQPEAIQVRLGEQVRRLLDTGAELDETRLYQEAAILAAKADIEEELQRIGAHVQAARELLEESEPVGRRLEFLAQEFNREANTLCSKANQVSLSQIGLRLKAVIDQMREQVQNIE